MNKKIEDQIALFKYGIISPLINGTVEEGISKNAFFRNASKKKYEDYKGEFVSLSAATLKRWYLAYQHNGFDGLKPKRRSDYNSSRKLDDDLKTQISFLVAEYPRIPATVIFEKLKENGSILEKNISLSTVTRYVVATKEASRTNDGTKDMRRYERKHINEVWCGDSSVGPYITIDGQKNRTYIIALIDDASRFIVGIDIFYNDNFINLMKVIKSGVSKFGKPKVFNFDNGSNYKADQMKLLAARIGTSINYNAPYTPTSKAKIERFFRTLKDQWMSTLNMKDFHTLDELQESMMAYVQKYNQTIHSSLDNITPQERFFDESNKIIRLTDEQIDKAFLLELERRVSADSVIVIDSKEYEVDYRYSGQKILLRYSPDLSKVYIVDKIDNGYTEIKLLDKQANSTIKRKKVRMTGDE